MRRPDRHEPHQAAHNSQLDLTVAATARRCHDRAGAKELPDDIMYDAIVKAHEEIKAGGLHQQIVAEIGREKMSTTTPL